MLPETQLMGAQHRLPTPQAGSLVMTVCFGVGQAR